MRRLTRTAMGVGACLIIAATPSAASAGTFGDVSPDGTVEVAAWVHVDGTKKGGGPPKCTWTKLSRGEVHSIGGQSWVAPQRPNDPPDDELTDEELAERDRLYDLALEEDRRYRSSWATHTTDGVEFGTWAVSCRAGYPGLPIVVAPVTIPDGALGDAIRAYAEERVPLPVPNTSPSFDVNAFVNLGLWLAVEPQTMETIGARAVDQFMEVTPVLGAVRWEFTQDETTTTVVCEGIGDPIKNLDVREQSPTCGHTYRRSSSVAGDVDITVTSIWDLPYASSSGDGTLGTIERSVSATHTVKEIQAVISN